MRAGVLDIQGDVAEHVRALREAGADVVRVKRPADLAGLSGLVIPGGESTTIGKLMDEYGLLDAVRERVTAGMGVFGTCAGAILLATDIADSTQPRLGLLDMRIRRNAYGRQRESFEEELPVSGVEGAPVKGVFIRAPVIERVGPSVEVLGTHRGRIALVRRGRILAGTFHPELTDDRRLHEYFLGLCSQNAAPSASREAEARVGGPERT